MVLGEYEERLVLKPEFVYLSLFAILFVISYYRIVF